MALAMWAAGPAAGQTVVTGGSTTTISAGDLETAGTLQFTQGTGAPGILQLTSSGPFTNSWSMVDAIAQFDLQGNSLTIGSLVPLAGNTASGTCTIGVQNGTLTLGENSFLTGFAGALQASNLGSIVIGQADWLTSTTAVTLDSTGGTPTLTWAGSAPVTYAGTLTLAGAGQVVISTTFDTGTLTMTGAVSGAADLVLRHAGTTATPTIILGLTGGGFTGRTILDGANVRIDTQESIGSAGLTLDGATLTAGTDLSIGGAQTLVVDSASTIVGTGAPGAFTTIAVDGEMQGTGNLTLSAIDLNIAGITSSYTGAVTLAGGSGLTVSNAAWLASASGISMNADGSATSLTWSGAGAATFAGPLDLGSASVAFIFTTQDTASLTLSGAVSGASSLVLRHTGSTADPTITLALTGGFTGLTKLDDANVRINTQASIGSGGLELDQATLTAGTDLEIGASQALIVTASSAIVGTGVGGALTSLTVNGQMEGAGNLALRGMDVTINGTGSLYTGAVSLGVGSELTVSNATWLSSVAGISMNTDGTGTSLTWSGAGAAAYSGPLGVGTGGTATVATTQDTAALTLTGAVSGTADLVLRHTGATADPTIILGLTGGGFTGRTILDGANVRIDTQQSIGSAGLTLDGATLTAGTGLAIGGAQTLVIDSASAIAGVGGGLTSMTIDGEMQGAGNLALRGMDAAINGATSAYTGTVSLGVGSELTVSNATWLSSVAGMSMNADGTATSLSYTGAAAVTSGMALSVGAGVASLSGTGPATALALTGSMSGSGTLSLEDIALSVNVASSAFNGGVALGAGSGLSVGSAAWLGGLGTLRFDANATVEYTGAASVTYGGALTLASNATFTASGAGVLTMSSVVGGAGDLTLRRAAVTPAPSMVLALSGGFTGRTILDTANVRINTQSSIGSGGLTLDAATLTAGTALTIGPLQTLVVDSASTITRLGAGPALTALTVDGAIGGTGPLTLTGMDVTVGNATSTYSGQFTLEQGSILRLDGSTLSNAAVLSGGGSPATLAGIGTLGSIGSPGNPFDGEIELGDRGVSAASVLSVTGSASLAASSILKSHFLSVSGGTGIADRLAAGGDFAAGSSKAELIFDPRVFDDAGGNWIPVPGVTNTYQFVTAAGTLNGTFGTVEVVTIDPVTGLPTNREVLDQSGETRFFGAGFSVDYSGNAFSVSILGIGGPDPLPVPGTTNTNVVVPVQVGATTIDRNANVGIVQNQQINASAAAMNLLAQTSTGDTNFVATQLLLQSGAAPYASSVVAVSGPANPYALPTTLMLGMAETGDVAMERLMQLRPQMTAPQAPPRQRGTGGPRSTAVAQSVATTRRKAFGAELNGPTPDEGMRGWARGFGFTGSFSNQSWAQTSYDSTLGNVAAGVDTVVGDGGILGGFVGYMPGSVSVTGGLVDESLTLNGVDFGLYGSWVPNRGEWYVSGAVSGAYTMIDRTRSIYVPGAVRTATSSSNAWAASFMGETGFNLPAGGDSYLSPYVRVAYNYFNQGSYNESGAGSMNLAVGSQSASALQPSVGARYMDGIRSGRSVITPFVGAAFTAFVPVGDWGVSATNPFTALPPISVYGDVETLYGGSVEAGVEVALPDGLTLFASFNGMFLSDTQVYGGRAGIQVPF